MLKRVSILLMVSILISLLGFTSGVLAQDATEVDFMTFSGSGSNLEYLNQMKEEFEKENPEIKINIMTVGYEDYFVNLQTKIAGGMAPDVYELNYENFVTYAKKNVLKELDTVIDQNEFDKSQLNEKALNAFQINDNQYGLPFSFSNVVMFYNEELFDQAGVDYPDSDWKWDDSLAAAKQIRDLGQHIYGIYQPVTFWEFYKMVEQNGGSIIDEQKKEFVINSPQNIKTLEYMIDRVQESNVMPTEAQLSGMQDWDLFKSGRVGMIVTGIWAFPDFAKNIDFEWDIAVEPGNTQKATHFFANGLVMNKKTDKSSEAFKWMSFLSASKEAAEIRVESGWELPAITDQEILSDYTEITPPENRKAVFESLNYLVTPPVIEQFAEMSDIINQQIQAARDGLKTPAEALNEAQTQLESTIEIN
ncbi:MULTISPECIES: ABC transporter substrate-binding protein [Halanaerobium]|uniref:Carbohydrate ABC transporter substrate-binding protein, CUT1 family n=1 Tax=Halanaerobium kushneri TaxID=56779 RepID=A0A1N6ZZK0_9FIRM|nr:MULTISPECIES: sugar ABC transporter substrate-binding protein [Halanaerobium]RCW60372.1 carbohydrate ABC transporter substrate-binding protein (CUT1 family) [Halanaerobium sp. ST460_2HS_T2]SIR32189.1 carbohydrate ABC transporter substrate-binding protein, CUT1 family [Halanaerobium kushneri]